MEKPSVKNALSPEQIFAEYEQGIRFKNSLGTRGMYEQDRINERFYVGDQWYGAHCGENRPLVRYNVIKRIGEYKLAVVGAAPVTVNYTADGVPETLSIREAVERLRRQLVFGGSPEETLANADSATRTQLLMSVLSDYFSATANRVNLDGLRDRALRNAYITGTGLIYTYWDETVPTGQHAADGRTPIRGDIACEVLEVEQVYFGDPTVEEVQKQPYILIAQRRPVEELRRQALRYGATREEAAKIRSDREQHFTNGEEPEGASNKATLLTRLWKVTDQAGGVRVMAQQVCRGVTLRPEWCLGVKMYPLAKFSWENRRGCAYGESEIPYLIPNQIAINRAMTAGVWATMAMGMPIMVVNGDVVTQPITNDPGQILQVYGSGEDVDRAVRFISPPSVNTPFSASVNALINNTLMQSGVNNVMLGDVQPENTSAIIAVREAALMPLTVIQSRFYRFLEEIAHQWAEFWACHYGKRALKVDTGEGVWYLPFDGKDLADRLIHARVDAIASTISGEEQTVAALGSLYDRGLLTEVEYLSRLPKGIIPDLSGLIRERRLNAAKQTEAPAPPEVSI